MLTLVIAGLTAVLDQIVKLIVQENMELGETIPLIRNVFHLTYIINPGAAFGIFPQKPDTCQTGLFSGRGWSPFRRCPGECHRSCQDWRSR